MNDFEIGYVAGLYEGEGTCVFFYNPAPYARLIIRMTNLYPLEKVQSMVGFGTINGPHTRKGKSHWQSYYNYQVSGFKNVQEFLTMIYPHLSPKRKEQACDCLGDDFAYEMGI